MKLFAGRETDLRDARTIVVRQGAERLDWAYIERHLGELAAIAERPELMDQLRSVRSAG